jgi:hypothetical protein
VPILSVAYAASDPDFGADIRDKIETFCRNLATNICGPQPPYGPEYEVWISRWAHWVSRCTADLNNYNINGCEYYTKDINKCKSGEKPVSISFCEEYTRKRKVCYCARWVVLTGATSRVEEPAAGATLKVKEPAALFLVVVHGTCLCRLLYSATM